MTLGKAPLHQDLHSSTAGLCDAHLSEASIYRLLHQECHRLFPDESFADLFHARGRNSVPPRIVAVVMVLQRFEGLSDREAVDRFMFDLRWKYACGGLDFDCDGFVHTVLVNMRARLRQSQRPNRIFDAVLDVAAKAGLVGRKRVLDSTALYDAVATQDTVTMIRAAIRGLLRVADAALAAELRAVLTRDDDYTTPGKPACEWDDTAAREALVDALARDGFAVLGVLDGRVLPTTVEQAAQLLARVLGQDLEQSDEGLFRIARRVAPDRVISTVDPEARHGHKTAARGFDGYKGHVAIDPDSEIITATDVTPGNVGDASAVEALLADVLPPVEPAPSTEQGKEAQGSTGAASMDAESIESTTAEQDDAPPSTLATTASAAEPVAVWGDASYGTANVVERLESAGIEANTKVQGPAARAGMFSQDAFEIDLDAGTVRCPEGVLVQLRPRKDGLSHASFGEHCASCPQRDSCTTSSTGRHINVHPKHDVLHRARERQRSSEWKASYRGTRPKVERKLAHMVRRRHGGRCARVRGSQRVAHDFALLAASINLARIAVLRPKGPQPEQTASR